MDTDNDNANTENSYTPASGRETEQLQQEESTHEEVKVLPGTGGPDDGGDIEVDPADLNMP